MSLSPTISNIFKKALICSSVKKHSWRSWWWCTRWELCIGTSSQKTYCIVLLKDKWSLGTSEWPCCFRKDTNRPLWLGLQVHPIFAPPRWPDCSMEAKDMSTSTLMTCILSNRPSNSSRVTLSAIPLRSVATVWATTNNRASMVVLSASAWEANRPTLTWVSATNLTTLQLSTLLRVSQPPLRL